MDEAVADHVSRVVVHQNPSVLRWARANGGGHAQARLVALERHRLHQQAPPGGGEVRLRAPPEGARPDQELELSQSVAPCPRRPLCGLPRATGHG